jgi:hypothetical protein
MINSGPWSSVASSNSSSSSGRRRSNTSQDTRIIQDTARLQPHKQMIYTLSTSVVIIVYSRRSSIELGHSKVLAGPLVLVAIVRGS